MDFCRATRHKGGMRHLPAAALPLSFALSLASALAGCGDPVPVEDVGNRSAAGYTEPTAMVTEAVPVRIGEAGASFAACNAAGTTRNLGAGETLPVRAAPFQTAAAAGALPAGSRFFICSRSHDPKWMGVVYDESGALSPGCGVSVPVTERRPYEGPCKSGWVASAFVKLISGIDGAPGANRPESAAAPPAGA